MRMWRSLNRPYAEAWDRILIGSSYLYLVIPIAIFLFGWLRLPFALLVTALLVLGTLKTLAGFGYGEQSSPGRFGFILLAFLIIAGWVLLSGIDAFGFQNSDFPARNTIFRDLIQHPWPVTYDYRALPARQAAFGDTGALVYYFTYWLPSALVGKMCGWAAANHALLAWSILGVFLSVMLVCRFVGAHSILLVIAFIAWSGMDIVGTLLFDAPPSAVAAVAGGPLQLRAMIGQTLSLVLGQQQLEGWASTNMAISLWQYSSFTTQLFWVFNQAIPAWLVTALLMNQQDKRSLICTFSLALLFAPLPAIGLSPFLLYRLTEGWSPRGHSGARDALRSLLSQTLSIQNTVPPALLAFVAVAFLGTQRAVPEQGFLWEFAPITGSLTFRYSAFCILEFFAFGLLTLRLNGDRRMLGLAMVVLLLLPLYRYGIFSDLVMRGSIPALLILFMIGFRNLLADPPRLSARSRLSHVVLAAVLLAGTITPLHEITRSIEAIVEFEGMPPPNDIWPTFAGSADPTEPWEEWSTYILASPQDTFFFRVLAK